MAYLEVIVQNGSGGKMAVSANGVSLARSNGCFGLFMGSYYPNAVDYFNGLEKEGWSMVSSNSTRTIGMIHGMPIAGGKDTYTFRGNGRYEIDWVGDIWQFKNYQYATSKKLEIEKAEIINSYDQMVRRLLTEVGNKYYTKKGLFSNVPDFEIFYDPPKGRFFMDTNPSWCLKRKSDELSNKVNVRIIGGRFPPTEEYPGKKERFKVYCGSRHVAETEDLSEEELKKAISQVVKEVGVNIGVNIYLSKKGKPNNIK